MQIAETREKIIELKWYNECNKGSKDISLTTILVNNEWYNSKEKTRDQIIEWDTECN